MNIHATDYYSISGGEYLKLFLGRYTARMSVGGMIFLVVMLSLSAIDYRWGLVLLMCIFILIPMLMSMICISEALRPEARYSIRRKSIRLSEKGIEAIFRENDESPVSIKFLAWESFKKASLHKKGIIVDFTDNNAFLFIPYGAFDSRESATEAFNLISVHVSFQF